jgi:hypothetical protein
MRWGKFLFEGRSFAFEIERGEGTEKQKNQYQSTDGKYQK